MVEVSCTIDFQSESSGWIVHSLAFPISFYKNWKIEHQKSFGRSANLRFSESKAEINSISLFAQSALSIDPIREAGLDLEVLSRWDMIYSCLGNEVAEDIFGSDP